MHQDADQLANLSEIHPATVKTLDLPGGDGAYWQVFPCSDSNEIRAEVIQPTVNLWSLGLWTWPEALAVVLALVVIVSGRWWWLSRKGNEPRCRKCSYELTGLKSETCPECGTALTSRNRVAGLRSKWRMSLAPAALLLIGVAWWLSESRVPRHGWMSDLVQWQWSVHRDTTGVPGHWGLDYHFWYWRHGSERFDYYVVQVETGDATHWQVDQLAISDDDEHLRRLSLAPFTRAWGWFRDSDAKWHFDADSRTVRLTRRDGEMSTTAVPFPEGEMYVWNMGGFDTFTLIRDEVGNDTIDYPFLPDPLGDGWYTVIDNRLLRVCFTTGDVTEVLALPEPAGDQDSTWELSPVREAPLAVAFNVDVEDAPTLLIDLQDRKIIDRPLDWPMYFHSWGAPVLVESEGTLVDEPVVDELLKVKKSIDKYGHFGCDLTRDRQALVLCNGSKVDSNTLLAADLASGQWHWRLVLPSVGVDSNVMMMTTGPSSRNVNLFL